MAMDEEQTSFDCVNVDKLTICGAPLDEHVKAVIEECIEAGLAEGGDILLAVKECIDQGIQDNGVILNAVKQCIADAGGSKVEIKQEVEGGVTTTTIIVDGGDPVVIESCCPDPIVKAEAAPAATEAAIQTQANTLAAGKAAGTNIKIVDEWGCTWGFQVDVSGVACRTDCPKHYNRCVDVRLPNLTNIVFEGPFSNQDRTAFDETISLTNLGCFEATVDIDVTGHSFFSQLQPGDSVFVWSGDLVQFNGANLTSPGQNDTAWAHTNDNTNGRQDIHQSSSHGAERHAILDPGAVGTLRYSHMTRSQNFFDIPSGIARFTIEGGSASLELNA